MIIDRTLGYGRHIIHDYLNKSLPFNNVLDIGAGNGGDLNIARTINPAAKLHAVEYYDPYVANLKQFNVSTYQINIEKERLPFSDESRMLLSLIKYWNMLKNYSGFYMKLVESSP